MSVREVEVKMKLNLKHKLMITVVKKGQAKNIVKATKKAGAEGGTILLGKGTGIHENKTFLGIPVEPEKEIILTLASTNIMNNVVNTIVTDCKINEPGKGLGMVIDLKHVGGICHLLNVPIENNTVREEERNIPMPEQTIHYELIVTIINKGDSDKVVEASKKAGAEGGTILTGRGTGIHEQAKFFNILIEPEKEIVLTLIDREKTDDVLTMIMKEAHLDEPGKGIAFVLDVERTVGINHILNEMVNEKFGR